MPLVNPLSIKSLAPIYDGVDSLHPTYSALIDMREKCRDVISGQDVIKKKGEKYLPRLSGQTDDAYKQYKTRALFFSIGAKSLQALVGMASLKDPKITSSDDMKSLYFNFDESISFIQTYTKMCHEVLLQNQSGAMVEWPKNGGNAYIIVFESESLINWDYDDNDNLIMVMIREAVYRKSDKYARTLVIRQRELSLDGNGDYIQLIYEDNVLVDTIKPKVAGKPLKEIPFVPFHSKGIGFTDEPPLLLDIANINISHYMTSADLEHGRHFTGLPTPIITGANSDTALHIGSNQFIVLPDKNANAKYLEFTGQGLKSLETALAEKQSMLASLSARLLDNSSKGSEATDAVKLRYLSETASLTTVVKTINVVLNMLYNIIATSLLENPNSVSIRLDTDFLGSTMTAAEMTALFNGYLGGAMDIDTLVYNLRVGRRLDPDLENAEVIKNIKSRAAEISSNTNNATQ